MSRPLLPSPSLTTISCTNLIGDYVHAVQLGVPAMAGQFGALYFVPVIYVPLLMLTHVAALVLVLRHWSHRTAGMALHARRAGET